MEYQKILLKRLLKMIEDNEYGKHRAAQIKKTLPAHSFSEEWWKQLNKLDSKDRALVLNEGRVHSNAAIKRVRIELNKAMIEWEKGE